MERFLQALSPALREEVRNAVQEHGQGRLEFAVSRYIDDEGNWPTESTTATMLARQFLTQTEEWESAHFAGSGITSGTIAALAGGALALGEAKGALVLANKGMQRYWKDIVQYSTGLNPAISSALFNVFEKIVKDTPWQELADSMTRDPGIFDQLMGLDYKRNLINELTGLLTRSAWRGARSGLNHVKDMTILDFSQENAWVENYIEVMAENQRFLSERTVRQVVNDALERGAGVPTITENIKKLWNLSPQHAAAVENYRKGLVRQEKTAGQIRRLTDAYADRLLRSRVRTLTETESLAAFNLGRETVWLRAVNEGRMPPDTVKMWVTAQDDLVCPICQPQDGAVATLGSPFEDVGIIVPPAHPNCRCLIVPVEGGIADFSTKKLIFPAREQVKKHLPGHHDQEEHGNWARRKLLSSDDFSPKMKRQLKKELTGSSLQETHDNIISYLKDRLKHSKVEVGFNIGDENKILDVFLGGESSVQHDLNKATKKRDHVTGFHSHPIPPNKKGVFPIPPSPTDVLIGLFTRATQIIVDPKGYYTIKGEPSFNLFSGREEIDRIKNMPEGKEKEKALTSLEQEYDRFDTVSRLMDASWELASLEASRQVWNRDDAKSLSKTKLDVAFQEAFTEVWTKQLQEILDEDFGFSFEFTPHSKEKAGISKKTITVKEHTRSDGTKVREHERKIKGSSDDGPGLARTIALGGLSAAASTAMLGVGLVVLRRLPKGVKIKPVNLPKPSPAPPQPSGYKPSSALQDAIDAITQAQPPAPVPVAPKYPSLLTGELDKIASKINKGIDPKLDWVNESITMAKGSSKGLQKGFEGGSLPDSMWRFSEMVSKSPSVGVPLQRGMLNVDPKIVNSYAPGRSITLAPSSFSTKMDVAHGFSGTGSLGQGKVIFHAGPQTRGLKIDALGKQMSWENEVLVSGRFRISRVEDITNIRHVWLEQTGILDYGTKAQWVAKMLRMFQSEKTKVGVSKHLIGQHDQKKHGKKGHKRADHTTQDRSKWLMTGYFGSYAVLYGGMMLVPHASKIKNAFTFNNIKNIPQIPKDLYKQYKTVSSIKALPAADKYKAIASYMNDGGKLSKKLQSQVKETKYISDTIRSWTSGQQGFYRQQLVMGKSDPAMDALAMAISSSAQRNAPLYRGFDVSGDALKAMTTPGNTFKLGPSGFSSDLSVAQKFAKNKYGFGNTKNTPVIFELTPGARALRIEKHANPSFKWEKEWISSGTFRVNNVTQSGGITRVQISQTELMIPNAMKLPTTQQMLKAQNEVKSKISPTTGIISKPETYAKVHGDSWWKKFDISDDLIEQSGVLSHGWISEGTIGTGTLESILAVTKRLFALENA